MACNKSDQLKTKNKKLQESSDTDDYPAFLTYLLIWKGWGSKALMLVISKVELIIYYIILIADATCYIRGPTAIGYSRCTVLHQSNVFINYNDNIKH